MPGPEERAARTAAFFDVDNTIIRGASAFHLARALHRRGHLRLNDILFFARHSLAYAVEGENLRRITALRARALRIAGGLSVADVIAIGEDVYDEVLDSRVYPGARTLLAEHLAAGHEVWLVTATPTEVAELIGRRLGTTGALGTRTETVDGRYTGALAGEMLHGAGKAVAVRRLAEERGIDLARSYAYGDSYNDIPLLDEVGHPCVINPEPRLRRHARRTGWPVRDFRRRRSVDLRSGARSASLAGTAWAVAVVVRALLRRLGAA